MDQRAASWQMTGAVMSTIKLELFPPYSISKTANWKLKDFTLDHNRFDLIPIAPYPKALVFTKFMTSFC